MNGHMCIFEGAGRGGFCVCAAVYQWVESRKQAKDYTWGLWPAGAGDGLDDTRSWGVGAPGRRTSLFLGDGGALCYFDTRCYGHG